MALFIYTTLTLLLCIPAREYIYKIDFENLSLCISTLLSVSSIVFAIIGVWIALIYPSAIKKIISNISDIECTDEEANKLAELIYVSITSAIILIIVVLFSLIKPLIPQNIKNLNLIIFIVLSICSLMQIHSILKVALMNIYLLINLRNKASKDHSQNIYK